MVKFIKGNFVDSYQQEERIRLQWKDNNGSLRTSLIEIYGVISKGTDVYNLKGKQGVGNEIPVAPLGIIAEDDNGDKYDLFFVIATNVIVAYKHK